MHAEDFIKMPQKYTRMACCPIVSRQQKSPCFLTGWCGGPRLAVSTAATVSLLLSWGVQQLLRGSLHRPAFVQGAAGGVFRPSLFICRRPPQPSEAAMSGSSDKKGENTSKACCSALPVEPGKIRGRRRPQNDPPIEGGSTPIGAATQRMSACRIFATVAALPAGGSPLHCQLYELSLILSFCGRPDPRAGGMKPNRRFAR